MKKKILLLSLILLILLTSCEIFIRSPKPKVHLITIALDYYNVNGNRLYGTIRDAREFAQAIKELKEIVNPTVDFDHTAMYQEGTDPNINDENYPTVANVLDRISEKLSNLENEDTLIIYYAGHGDTGLLDAPIGSLALAHEDNITKYETASTNQILSLFKNMDKGRAVLILDSCYSGNYIPDYPNFGLLNDKEIESYNSRLTVISASSANNDSYEKAILRDPSNQNSFFNLAFPFNDPENHIHGVFTDLFLEAIGWDHNEAIGEEVDNDNVFISIAGFINDKNIPTLRNGTVTFGDIYHYIRLRLTGQRSLTINGPIDTVLFSSWY
jgi:hypothetical protein